jgi:hypothetical protein
MSEAVPKCCLAYSDDRREEFGHGHMSQVDAVSRRMSLGSVALEAQRPIPNPERMRNGHKPKASFYSAVVAARLKSLRAGHKLALLLFAL